MKIGDESSGEDDSDEDWGKNVKNVVSFDDNESEENESFKEEESVERKRKRKPVTTQKGDSRRKRFRKKIDGKSQVGTLLVTISTTVVGISLEILLQWHYESSSISLLNFLSNNRFSVSFLDRSSEQFAGKIGHGM